MNVDFLIVLALRKDVQQCIAVFTMYSSKVGIEHIMHR